MESNFLKFGQKVRLCRNLFIYLTYEPQKPSNVRNVLCKTYRIGSCGSIKSKTLKIGSRQGWWQVISVNFTPSSTSTSLYIYNTSFEN